MAINQIDQNQGLKNTKVTLPNDPPMGIPSQWGYQPLVNPVPGQGTAQYQNALNPRIAPNLSEYPLGVDPLMWNTYLGNNPYSDYSWDNQMAGIVQPANVQDWIMRYLTPQQRAQVTPDQIAALTNGGSTQQPTFNMLGGLGGLGGYSPTQWPFGQSTPGIGNSPVVSAAVNMGSANPLNVAAMSMPSGMPQYDMGGNSPVYSTAPLQPVNYADQLHNQPQPQPIGTYPLATTTGQGDLASQVSDLYKSIMGRAPTQDTLDYFLNDIGSGKATANDLQNTLQNFVQANGRLGNQPFNNSQDAIWMNAMDQGRQAVAGIDRMPFMYSNYAGIPSDPSAAFNLFYPQTTLTDYQKQLLGLSSGDNSASANSQYYFPRAAQEYRKTLEDAKAKGMVLPGPALGGQGTNGGSIDDMVKAYDQNLFLQSQRGNQGDLTGSVMAPAHSSYLDSLAAMGGN